jgi:hypothetical protein
MTTTEASPTTRATEADGGPKPADGPRGAEHLVAGHGRWHEPWIVS